MAERPRIETDSRTWRAVKAWAEMRLQSSRATLEAPGYGPVETEFERGRISAAKELLGLAEQNTHPADSTESSVE